MNTTRSIGEEGERQSMISRRYGVRSVRQGPGSAEARCESVRYLSDHSETVSSGSGRAPAAAAAP
jgi:hypothetical protein